MEWEEDVVVEERQRRRRKKRRRKRRSWKKNSGVGGERARGIGVAVVEMNDVVGEDEMQEEEKQEGDGKGEE